VDSIEICLINAIRVDKEKVPYTQPSEKHRDSASGPSAADNGYFQISNSCIEGAAEQASLPVEEFE
jgi:hypothetical protein